MQVVRFIKINNNCNRVLDNDIKVGFICDDALVISNYNVVILIKLYL